MLPWLRERPLNLFRCPGEKCFFQRHTQHPPTMEGTFGPALHRLPVQQKNGKLEDYLYLEDEAGIEAAVAAQTLEFHGWGSRIADVEKPDRLIIDLDPDEDLAFDRVREAAYDLRARLADLSLRSFPLLTGGKGIHVVVPLVPDAEWPQVREFARSLCAELADAQPDRYTVALQKQKRRGRIFLDYLRNQRTATAVLPYSLRARAGLPVAAPVAWDELDAFATAGHFHAADAALLLRRSRRKALRSWGVANQQLPSEVRAW
jgi:bifunctional non-homologous end joining protein LigD